MNTPDVMREEIKNYIEKADDKVLKMVHAMLEANEEENWWDAMPDNVKADVEAALAEADNGVLIPHEQIQKRYKKWLAK